ncbi:hypothetical protein HMSSN036_18110 [Paenibacillus macerans]|nr:hypothetical protein HMSSN036_18110 [Paenibacillus macerans]
MPAVVPHWLPAGELTAESWLTTPDRKNLLTPQPVSVFSGTDKPADTVIEVDAGRQYQTIEGFGAAVTGSSAYLIGGKLSASQREGLLDDLFTEDGIRLSYVRHTIGASDFRWMNQASRAVTPMTMFLRENRILN